MELTKSRNTIVKLLHEHTGRPIVMLRQSAERPLKDGKVDYPFLGYQFLSTFIKDKGTGNYDTKEIPSMDPRYRVDLLESVEMQPQFTISFTAYSKDSIEAKSLALKAWEFFKLGAYRPLARENIIIIDIANVSNRDIFEVDVYERREGFDVRFRSVHRIQHRLETIEKYKVKKEVK